MDFDKLQTACNQFGKRGLALKLGIAESTLYAALQNHRGLRPVYMLQIDRLLADAIPQEQSSAEPTTALSQLERLILDNVHKMTEQAQAEVLAVTLDMLKNPNNLISK